VPYNQDLKVGAQWTFADLIWKIFWISEARLTDPPRKWKAKFIVRRDGTGEPRPIFDP